MNLRSHRVRFGRFVNEFWEVSWHVRSVLGVLLMLLPLGALVVSLSEGIDFWNALYFAFVTATTVGYGDITPATVPGRIVSVMLGFVGLIYFGLVVAVATKALQNTVDEEPEDR